MAKKLTTLGKTVGNLGRLSCSLSLLLGAQMSFATGITMITSELVPLAINAEGMCSVNHVIQKIAPARIV